MLYSAEFMVSPKIFLVLCKRVVFLELPKSENKINLQGRTLIIALEVRTYKMNPEGRALMIIWA